MDECVTCGYPRWRAGGHAGWCETVEQWLRVQRPRVTKRALATHCRRGHLMDRANTYIQPSTGNRYCRACQRLREKHLRDLRRAVAGLAAVPPHPSGGGPTQGLP
jgi:hypothetical protein